MKGPAGCLVSLYDYGSNALEIKEKTIFLIYLVAGRVEAK